jgi:hypothetical protein
VIEFIHKRSQADGGPLPGRRISGGGSFKRDRIDKTTFEQPSKQSVKEMSEKLREILMINPLESKIIKNPTKRKILHINSNKASKLEGGINVGNAVLKFFQKINTN